MSAMKAYSQAEQADFCLTISDEDKKGKEPFDVLLLQYRETVVNSLVTAFGLDRFLFVDIDGGNVQTIHNAENHVYANEEFRDRGERPYNREDYASANDMNARRKKDFRTQSTIEDGYTGRELPKDGQAHLEHVVSAKENHDNTAFRVLFEKEEMRTIINDGQNTLYTDSSINQSKGDSPLSDWMDRQKEGEEHKNAERFGVDREKATAADKKARKHIDEKVARRKMEHYASSVTQDGLKQGGAMAVRQALGVVFTELTMTVWDEIPSIKSSLGSNFSAQIFFKHLVTLVEKSFSRIKEKMRAILDAFSNGFVSGFLNSVVTTIINLFATTAKNLVRVIRQAMTSITEAVRILFFDKVKRSPGERLMAAVKVILTGAATLLGVLLEQSLHEVLAASGLAAIPIIGGELVEVISVFAGILVTGLLSVTFLYVLDNSEKIKELIAFIDTLFTDGIAKAKEKMEAANRLLDEYIAKLCEIDVEKLKKDVTKLHMLNAAVVAGDVGVMYNYCYAAGIPLQFSNTEEFNAFMEDDDTILEI
jgi:hypothetical protein